MLVVDGGSRDDTAAVADVGGCNFLVADGPLGRRLKTAVAWARAPWLLFLRPGTILDAPWIGETTHFVERAPPDSRAAVFRRAARAAVFRPHGIADLLRPGLGEIVSLLRVTFGGGAKPEQGLLIAQRFYQSIGGHPGGADAEAALLRKLGRRRIAMLPAGAGPSR